MFAYSSLWFDMARNGQFFSVQNFHDMTFDFQCINIFFVKHISSFFFYFSTKSATVQKEKLLELNGKKLVTTVDEFNICIYVMYMLCVYLIFHVNGK